MSAKEMKTLTIGGVQYKITDENIGLLENLNTTQKSTIVDAINELVANSNSGIDSEQVNTLIQEYLSKNPPVAYTLPIATETTLGGVKAAAATEEMTQPVGITAEGKLVTVPCQDSGGNVDLTGYATEQWVKDQKYLTEVPEGYAKTEDIPKKPEDIGAQPSGDYALRSEIPTRGVDYWTDADQESIVQQVIVALGTPVFGRVDENKVVTLTGTLADGTYTFVYENENGEVTTIGEYTKSPEIVNMIKESINADGTPYVGDNGEDGYNPGYRLNSSGTETAAEAFGATGFIPVKYGNVVYFKNVNFTPGVESTGGGNYIAVYDSSFGKIESVKSTNVTADHYLFKPIEVYADSGLIKSIALLDGSRDYAYLRVSATGLNADSIITVNQPIE